MVIYDFACDVCEIVWDKEGSMKKPPKRMKCPKCGKQKPRILVAPPVHFKGPGFRTILHRQIRDYNNELNTKHFQEEAIKKSKERMATGWQHYSRMDIKPDQLQKLGVLKARRADKQDKYNQDSKNLAHDIKASISKKKKR